MFCDGRYFVVSGLGLWWGLGGGWDGHCIPEARDVPTA